MICVLAARTKQERVVFGEDAISSIVVLSHPTSWKKISTTIRSMRSSQPSK